MGNQKFCKNCGGVIDAYSCPNCKDSETNEAKKIASTGDFLAIVVLLLYLSSIVYSIIFMGKILVGKVDLASFIYAVSAFAYILIFHSYHRKISKQVRKEKEEQYDKFVKINEDKGLTLYDGYWWKPIELNFRKKYLRYWADKKESNDYKGDHMYCKKCHYEWKIKKDRGLPARCGRCSSLDIMLNVELSYEGAIGTPEFEDMKI